MPDPTLDGLSRSRWNKRTGRIIDAVCFVALVAVVGTVVYGLTLRGLWAHGYLVCVAVALLGAFVMLVGLAQQAIAARDAATWRAMAEWQISAARARITAAGSITGKVADDLDSPDYYEYLIGTLVEHAVIPAEKDSAR